MKYKLGIIGTGVMGQAILKSVIANKFLSKEQIIVFDVSEEKKAMLKAEGYNVSGYAKDITENAEYILISVKPQHFDSVSESISVSNDNCIISIMAGIKTETIKNKLGSNSKVARVMPNTPCQIGKGVCAIVFNGVSDDQQSFIISMLKCCGEVVKVDESLFDAVTSVSGSGPAYVYMFIDGMIKGGMDGGLSYEQSKKLAINTVIGAAELAYGSNETADALTEKVCSKGGTTIEAVNIYRNDGLKELICKGITACRKRSEEMSRA